MNTYRGNGLTFQYPDSWTQTEERAADSVTITIGDDGAFWSVTVLNHCPEPEDVLEQAIAAFREEYKELDVYTDKANVGGATTVARQLEFVSLELINLVWLRSCQQGGVTWLVMAQVTDHEKDTYSAVFQSLDRSLRPLPDEERPLSLFED